MGRSFNFITFLFIVFWSVYFLMWSALLQSSVMDTVITGELGNLWAEVNVCFCTFSAVCLMRARRACSSAGSGFTAGVRCVLANAGEKSDTHTHMIDCRTHWTPAVSEWTDYLWWEALASPDGWEECVSVAPCLFDDPSSSDAPAGHMSRVTQPWGTR